MAEAKRCIFCGALFAGQKKNFEHIVPRWLVEEADLSKRDMEVNLPDRYTKMGMSRIGIKVWVTCNDDGSQLESAAKEAYLAVANGNDLTEVQLLTLLNWLDKVRVGIWLWLVEQTRETAGVVPKFRINSRLGTKDRFLFLQRYKPEEKMKGLAFTGLGPYFIGLPDAFGMLINNVFLGSASGDFLVLRHMRDVKVHISYGADDLDEIETSSNSPSEPRIGLLGGPSVFGQCIMPTEMFETMSVPILSVTSHNESWSESPVLRLDSNLRERPDAPANVPLWKSAIKPNKTLMDINVEQIEKFLVVDWSRGDSNALDERRRKKIKQNSEDAIEQIDIVIGRLKFEYFVETGLRLI